jgi:hypothetical protein
MFARDFACDFKVKIKTVLLKVAIFLPGTKYLEKKLLLLANDYVYTVFLMIFLKLIKSLEMT